jgi:GT2 family glycosyltransferase
MSDKSLIFSVIVPTFNRPAALERCLTSLAAQDFPVSGYEIIVMNDGGVSLAAETVECLRQKNSLVLLEQPNRGQGAARNRAASQARGEFLAFIDDDCAASPAWLSTIYECLQSESHLVVGGRTRCGLPGNSFALANEILIDFLYDYYHLAPGEKSQPPFFTSNNLALSRAAFQAVGGFDERLRGAEDRDLCERLHAAGCSLYYTPSALVYHYQELSLSSFLGLHYHYGRWNFRFHQYRRLRGWGNYRLEPAKFYSGMLRYPFTNYSGRRAVGLSGLLALSQLENFAGFSSQAFISFFDR